VKWVIAILSLCNVQYQHRISVTLVSITPTLRGHVVLLLLLISLAGAAGGTTGKPPVVRCLLLSFHSVKATTVSVFIYYVNLSVLASLNPKLVVDDPNFHIICVTLTSVVYTFLRPLTNRKKANSVVCACVRVWNLNGQTSSTSLPWKSFSFFSIVVKCLHFSRHTLLYHTTKHSYLNSYLKIKQKRIHINLL
jgi:hypothetical protein